MILCEDYVQICDLFENTVRRAAQLSALSSLLQDALLNPDSSPQALHGTAWLLTDLLVEQQIAISKLQDAHRRNHLLQRDPTN